MVTFGGKEGSSTGLQEGLDIVQSSNIGNQNKLGSLAVGLARSTRKTGLISSAMHATPTSQPLAMLLWIRMLAYLLLDASINHTNMPAVLSSIARRRRIIVLMGSSDTWRSDSERPSFR